jgi:hypothetical protein
MRLSIAIEPADRRPTQSLPVTRDHRPREGALRSVDRPLAAFVAHLAATRLRFPQTCARRRGAQVEASGIYSAALSLSYPEKPALDRSV